MRLFKNIQYPIYITIIVSLIWGCADEFDTFTPLPDAIKLTSILDPSEASVEIVFQHDMGISFSTSKGTRISIPADAFNLDGSNNNGDITFHYLEIYSKGDKIKFDVPTISNGRLLSSDGVFYFEAKFGETNINLRPGKKIQVQMINFQPDSGMELFYGDRTQERFNWNEQDQDTSTTGGIQILEQRDTTGELLIGYEFFTDSLRWINVDIFVDVPKEEKTEVCIELPEIYHEDNTTVYMVFRNYNSVLALHAENESSNFCEPYGATPIGAEVIFVVISKQGEEEYHFAIMDDIITENYVAELFPEATTMTQIITALNNL